MSETETAEPPAKRRRVVVGNTRPEPKVQAGVDIFSPVSRESTWGLGEGENKQLKIKGVMYSKIFVCFGQILI